MLSSCYTLQTMKSVRICRCVWSLAFSWSVKIRWNSCRACSCRSHSARWLMCMLAWKWQENKQTKIPSDQNVTWLKFLLAACTEFGLNAAAASEALQGGSSARCHIKSQAKLAAFFCQSNYVHAAPSVACPEVGCKWTQTHCDSADAGTGTVSF